MGSTVYIISYNTHSSWLTGGMSLSNSLQSSWSVPTNQVETPVSQVHVTLSHRVGHNWNDLAAAAAAGCNGFPYDRTHQLGASPDIGSGLLLTQPICVLWSCLCSFPCHLMLLAPESSWSYDWQNSDPEFRTWGAGSNAWSLGQTFHLYRGSILLSVRWHFRLFLFHEAVLLCNLQYLFLCSLETICTKVETSQTIDLFFKRFWFSEVKNYQNPNLMIIMRIICS